MGRIGELIGYLVPSNVFEILTSQRVSNLSVIFTLPRSFLNYTSSNTWLKTDKQLFLIFFVTFLVGSFVVFMFIVFLVQDHLPTPATKAQIQLRQIRLRQELINDSTSSKRF